MGLSFIFLILFASRIEDAIQYQSITQRLNGAFPIMSYYGSEVAEAEFALRGSLHKAHPS